MADDKIIPASSSPQVPATQGDSEALKGTAAKGGVVKVTGKVGGLHARLAAAAAEKPVDPELAFRKAAEEIQEKRFAGADNGVDPLMCSNRIAIKADVSGSMGDRGSYTIHTGPTKIELLKQALLGFMDQVNFETTSCAIYTFPLEVNRHYQDDNDDPAGINTSYTQGAKFRLSTNKLLLDLAVQGLRSGGGTPMSETMDKVLQDIPLTRGIIISDGEADRPEAAIESAKQYARSETVIDCVHIGQSASGEDLLKRIAEITHGIYLKFDNVENFAKSFSYLTPEKRAKLALVGTVGSLAERSSAKAEVAKMLGAKEIK